MFIVQSTIRKLLLNVITKEGFGRVPYFLELSLCSDITSKHTNYVGYSESRYRLRISLAHPRDCHFAHVQ